MAKIYYESELTHSGVKNMKWGQRRYQNKDGSLTPLGRIHYGIKNAKRKKSLKKARAAKAEKKKQAELEAAKPKKPKSAKEMSEAELKAAIEHLKLEKEFQQRYNELNPPAVNKGKELVKKLASEVAGPMLKDAGTELVKSVAVPYLKKQLGIDDSAADGTKKVLDQIDIETKKAKMQIEKAKAEKEILDAKQAKELHDDFMNDREKKRQKVAEREAQEKANKEAKEKAAKDATNKAEQEARSKANEKVKAAKDAANKKTKAESEAKDADYTEIWGENLDDWMDAPKTKKQTSEGSNWTKKNRETFDAEWSEVSDSDVSSGEQFALALLDRDK